MPDSGALVVRLKGVIKDYRGLRPLRVRDLELGPSQSVALLGFDRAAAEVLVNLIIGSSVPDAGDVIVFGRPTRDITDGTVWLSTLEQFGLLSDRQVLIEQLTAEQNLALPLTFEVDDLPAGIRARVADLADEVGFPRAELPGRVDGLAASSRLRLRLGRALALNPRLLLVEHPTATLEAGAALPLAADLSAIVARRGIASVVLTADQAFAAAVAPKVLTLLPGTGELRPTAGWRRWFG